MDNVANNVVFGQVSKLQDISHISLISQCSVNNIDNSAFYGLAGDIVRAIEPYTEADLMGILVQLLSTFGNLVGKNPHFRVENDYHALKIYPVLVGDTSKGRKGTSWARVKNLFTLVDPVWSEHCIASGSSSGEGLIWHVRDSSDREKDPGISDKRLLVVEPEFAMVLRQTERQGNTLSAIIRQAWDSDSLRSLTKNSPLKATGVHVTVLGHITSDELRRYLDTTEVANGFGNRFLWIKVSRSKILPEGGNIKDEDLQPFIDRLKEAKKFASSVGEIKRDNKARQIWFDEYPRLSEGKHGMVGALTARAEAYVMRLACIYALLDCSVLIREEHLRAAVSLWDYAEMSVESIFGESLGDFIADTIWVSLKRKPEGLNRTEINALFGRHKSTKEIDKALTLLDKLNHAKLTIVSTGGRPEERWIVLAK